MMIFILEEPTKRRGLVKRWRIGASLRAIRIQLLLNMLSFDVNC